MNNSCGKKARRDKKTDPEVKHTPPGLQAPGPHSLLSTVTRNKDNQTRRLSLDTRATQDLVSIPDKKCPGNPLSIHSHRTQSHRTLAPPNLSSGASKLFLRLTYPPPLAPLDSVDSFDVFFQSIHLALSFIQLPLKVHCLTQQGVHQLLLQKHHDYECLHETSSSFVNVALMNY